MPDAWVIVNARSGRGADSGPGVEALADAFIAHGLRARVQAVRGADLAAQARRAVDAGAGLVIAGGGDGTVNAVATVVAGTSAALGVLPLGTLNHFARDLGLPLDLPGAIAACAAGARRRIDVGEVNGRAFLNNASIGLYPALVLERDEERRAFRRGKYQAMALALARAARRLPLQRVRLGIAGRSLLARTPFVFVANNAYRFRLGGFARRPCLDDGLLWCYLPRRHGRRGFARLVLAAALGDAGGTGDLAALPVRRFVLQSHRRLLPVALDGEVVHLRPPLRFRTRAGALAVAVAGEPACA